MPHEATLVATLAVGFGLAMAFGFLAAKLRMPPLVGYLVAGILIGPHTRGFVGDVRVAGELAEVGVMLLMFGVGLHFSFENLAATRFLVTFGAPLQIAVATGAGLLVATAWHWPFAGALIFGLCLSVSSTVVLLRSLESRKLLNTFNGQLAVAWLVLQDLVMVLVLVLVPAFVTAGRPQQGIALTLAIVLAKAAAFVVLMVVAGKRVFPVVLWAVAKTGSRELFTLAVVAAAVGVAFGSALLFGVSFALGAFFAGMMMRESSLSHRAAQESLPLQDAFAVLFFLSVGMLFDPRILVDRPGRVAITVLVVMIANAGAATGIIRAFRYPPGPALTVGAGLTQIGEFSFILASLGVSLKVLPGEGYNLVLAAALVTIALNPLSFAAAEAIERRLHRPVDAIADPLGHLPMSTDPSSLEGHVVLVGHGRVGRRIAEALTASRVPLVIVEQSREIVDRLRRGNLPAVSGDASEPEVLVQAHVARARMLVIATPDPRQVRKMIATARMVNPAIAVVVRTHSDEEAQFLRAEGAGEVFMGEHELASGMTRHVLTHMTAPGV